MEKITDKAEKALANADALGDEVGRIFVQLDRQRIMADAEKLEKNRHAMQHLPLYGTIVSLKDLFDEAGQVTSAGSLILKDRPAAEHDAVVVARLKAAGALFFGRTSMTEFAYSGIGINPHYGTPGCIFDRSLIPGGSSSGAALSVAHGLCDIGMGTDTGGSVRLPAAINGLYGYKPSAQTVPTSGVHPLSTNFDSVGPLTATLAEAITCLNIISDAPVTINQPARSLKLAIASDSFGDDLDPHIASAFEDQLDQLRTAGHSIENVSLKALNDWTQALIMTVSYEARSYYKDYLDVLKTQGDQHVLSRMQKSDGMTDADLAAHLAQRQIAVDWFSDQLRSFDALLAPTFKCERPSIEDADKDFNTHNPAVLRNTTYINLVDGCGLSIPVERKGAMPTALMICGPNGHDQSVLNAGVIIDQCLNGTSA